jgi:hypothetical protein
MKERAKKVRSLPRGKRRQELKANYNIVFSDPARARESDRAVRRASDLASQRLAGFWGALPLGFLSGEIPEPQPLAHRLSRAG